MDNPEQQEFLRQLEPVIEARVGHLREGISLMKSGAANRAFDRVKEGGGKELMDKIRQLITQFCETEERLLRQRQSNEAVSRNVLLGLIIGGLAALSAIAVSVVRSQRRLIAQLQDEARKREAAEATLRQAQKTEAVGQLTGGIAHDFNNLLTVILGNLDTIRRRLANADPSVTAPLARPLDAALQGVRGAAKLTHRLLAFSRQQPLEPKPLDLNKLLRGMSDMLERTVGAPSEMEMVLMGGLWPTFADANQLENALINLVVNARDAMPGGGKITIETANGYLDEAYAARFVDVKPGQYVVLSVTTPDAGLRLTSWSASSILSLRRRSRERAQASACPWFMASSNNQAAISASIARLAKAPPSKSICLSSHKRQRLQRYLQRASLPSQFRCAPRGRRLCLWSRTATLFLNLLSPL